MPWWAGSLEDWWYSLRRGRREVRAHDARRAFVREAAARGEAHVGSERDIHKLIRDAAGGDLAGWEQIREGAWTRPLAGGIRALICTRALKGMKHQLLWGLSLPWVPHLTATGSSLHRTAKSARLDLYEEGQFHDAAVTYEWGDDGAAIWLPTEVECAWRLGFERATDFFACAVDAEAVLALAQDQLEDQWVMTVHMPGPVYVAAFTLAHLGREIEARAMLERQRQKWYLHPDPPQARPAADEKLARALDRTLRQS
jgi:hypothetical protein